VPEVTPKSALQQTVDDMTGYSRRTRKLIWGLVVSIALDVALTVVLGLTAFQAHDAASSNTQLVQKVNAQQATLHVQQVALHAAQLSACANGNVFRVNQTTIWHDFVRILTTPTPSSTKAQVAQADKLAAQFLAFVGQVNHKVNCVKLYGK
jgi:hypothetical protein